MMETYKITNETQFRSANHILLLTGLFVGGMAFVIGSSIIDKDIYLLVFSMFYLFQLVLWSIIHWNYYKTNRNDEITFDINSNNEFRFSSNAEIIRFSTKDIVKVYVCKSPPLHKKHIRLFAWDDYNHIKIILNSGKTIVLTSLMFGGEIQIPVEEEKVIRKLNLFRLVRQKSLTGANR